MSPFPGTHEDMLCLIFSGEMQEHIERGEVNEHEVRKNSEQLALKLLATENPLKKNEEAVFLEAARKGLIDVNATVQGKRFRRCSLFELLADDINYGELFAFLLPQVNDPNRITQINGTPKHPFLLLNDKHKISAMLSDPRLDPCLGTDDFDALGKRLRRRYRKIQKLIDDGDASDDIDPPPNPEELRKQDISYITLLRSRGFYVPPIKNPWFKHINEECGNLWKHIQSGKCAIASLDGEQVRRLASFQGAQAVFDAALWRGEEDRAFEMISTLPYAVQYKLSSEISVLNMQKHRGRSWGGRIVQEEETPGRYL